MRSVAPIVLPEPRRTGLDGRVASAHGGGRPLAGERGPGAPAATRHPPPAGAGGRECRTAASGGGRLVGCRSALVCRGHATAPAQPRDAPGRRGTLLLRLARGT